uniref:Chitin-binding type-2 domain-containing protein n=1 Tax=Strigamia maritima TaxID=126957 RepID=T1IYW5_STRMM
MFTMTKVLIVRSVDHPPVSCITLLTCQSRASAIKTVNSKVKMSFFLQDGQSVSRSRMRIKVQVFAVLICFVLVRGTSIRYRRQDTFSDKDLCEDKNPGEYFRLYAEDDCRDVVRCSVQGLLALRCPAGLAFDIEKQTCDWRDAVKNCDTLQKNRKPQPLLSTEEPLCTESGKLACNNAECIDKTLFCDGKPDCQDESDENACSIDQDPNRAPVCDPSECTLPDCFCSVDGTRIPDNLEPEKVPQMVLISFDDAVNINNIDMYNEFFDEWTKEIAGSRLIIEKFANITDNSVVGMRAPYLRVGGNNQFLMMEEQSFLYDSTMTAPLSNPPLWPYTLYYKMPHRCHGNGQKCPTRPHAVWEMVMNELDRRDDPNFDEDLPGCAMVDSCSTIINGQQFYNFLNHNFNRHYNSNRAPLGLYFHAVWLKNNPELKISFLNWIDEMLNRNDVYFVTMTQAIQWIQNPTELGAIQNFAPWKEDCDVQGQPHCHIPNACPLSSKELAGEGATIVKRQADDETVDDEDLCKGREPGEYFRLSVDDNDDCRDVVRCSVQGLLALRCPSGLAFDVEKQTCQWKDKVKNCDQREKPSRPKPLFSTSEPVCPEGKLSCADSECLDRALFCDGKPDCKDESDEGACTVDQDPNRAGPCDTSQCNLPDCFCSADGTRIPGNMDPSATPQMVTISFDDAINVDNIDLYFDIFHPAEKERKNPNGCTIKGTFFLSHKYANYSAVQEMHRRGHEIAVHSITHRNDEKFWTEATVDDWVQEMAGGRLIIEKFANISDGSVIGVRAPYLRVGGNNQFGMMEEQGFLYDSSITAPLSNPPLWPYTLYFRMPHKCHGNSHNCPSRSHAVWEMVMNEMDRRDDPNFDEDLPGCAMVDSCSNINTAEQFANFLRHNFNRHYNTNKAPFGLYFHASWLKSNKNFRQVFIDWIDEVLQQRSDVYFVTMTQVIQWMQTPVESAAAKDFPGWKEECDIKGTPYCSLPNACPVNTKELPGETIRLHTCMQCPDNYPWLEDPTGDGLI